MLFALITVGGCKIKTDIVDPYVTKEFVVLVPNTLLDFQKVTEAIVETIVEITTVIDSAQLNETTTFPTTQSTPKSDSEILQRINEIRRENGLKDLMISDDLCLIAEIRAEEASKLWSHTRPNGKRVDSLADKIEWCVIGENLAKHKNAPTEKVVEAWVNSKSHYENIINPRFIKCGIGEFKNGDMIYISMIFTD